VKPAASPPPSPDGQTVLRAGPDPELVDLHCLTVVFSPDPKLLGRVQRLPRQRMEIGRNPAPPGLALGDATASRVHASVSWDPGRERYLLRDEDSRNGVALNGQEIEAAALAPGDVLRIGDTLLLFGHLDLEVVGWSAPRESLLQGRSLALRRLLDPARGVARGGLSVLLRGELGAGKRRLAAELHRLSGRKGPLLRLRCPQLSPEAQCAALGSLAPGAASGLLHEARAGSLLVEELTDLAPAAQTALLAAADLPQDQRPRLLSTTRRDPQEALRMGLLRPEVLAALDQWSLWLPPLRERREDLPLLWAGLQRSQPEARRLGLSCDACELLLRHAWPHNVAELEALQEGLRQSLPAGETVELQHLPVALRDAPDPRPEALPAPGKLPLRHELVGLLRHYHGNLAEVAGHTGRDRSQVFRWLRRYGLNPDDYRRGAPG